MRRLFNYKNFKEEELKNINFSKAHFSFVDDSDIENSIRLSGILIIEKLLSNFFSEQKVSFSFYVDFSTIASTIETNNLLDYILINNCCEYLDISRIENNYYSLYGNLKNNNKGLFYHPNFFLKPKNDNFYLDQKILVSNKTNTKGYSSNENRKVLSLQNSPSSKNIHYTVTKLGIDFIHFTKESNKIQYAESLEELNSHLLNEFNSSFAINNLTNRKLYSFLLSIPIIGFNSSFENNDNFEGQGSIFLYAITDQLIENSKFEELAVQISNISKDITYNYLLTVGLKLAEKSRKNAIKSSVAAIMSRNMSHNLGSHVLSNLKGELEDIANVFKAKHDKNKNIGFKSENLYGLKWFINYLQERQDFIATIGGFENQTFMPVSFKSFVFDGLLPDHQFSRHHYKRDNNGEENNETALNAHKNYLLEYIIKSENVKRDQIVVKYREFISSVSHEFQNDDDYKKLGQIMVSFPGGIVGRQAFFSIFENILRNAAKHNTIKNDEILKLTINTPDDDSYDANEFIKFTITDNLKSFTKAYPKLKEAINEPIFNESQEKQGNKGIKEMKISAAWLRGISLEDIDNHKEIKEGGITKIPKILDVVESNQSLQYVFYLLKPKELLLFLTNDEKEKLVAGLDVELLEENGINIITPEYFNHKKNYNLRHSLFVIQSDLEGSEKENIEKYFNQRKLFLEVDKLRRIFVSISEKSNPEALISAFWKEYLGFKEAHTLPQIHIRPKEVNKDEQIFTDGFNVKLNSDQEYDINTKIKIIFKHHNDTEKYFDDFQKKHKSFFEGLNFLEGISGGNSTDLLLCRTEKTELFYYKLFQSCVTDIIIVDERLWNNNSKTDIEELSKMLDGNKVLFTQQELDKINKIKDKGNWASSILQALKVEETTQLINNLIAVYNFRDKNTFFDLITKDILKVEAINISFDNCKSENDYKYWLYKKKNIEVANILFANTGFEFYNLNLEKIGQYSTGAKLSLNLSINKYPHKIISFHQGIIDKIQNMLNEFDETKSLSAITIINEAIPKNYIKIIHSGRGKPSVKIPAEFYYVPYASLESAFYDCKFSLADLLFNSKAELT